MATVIANTVLSNQANTKRQSIDDGIYMLSQENTPVLTMVAGDTSTGKRKASSNSRIEGPTHEWQEDVLEAADRTATTLEGATFDFGAQSQPANIKNHTQINTRPIIVSGTTQATKLVGRPSTELARLKIRAMERIKKDKEQRILFNDASVRAAANTATKGVSGSLHTFLKTNTSRGAGGADGGYDPTTGLTVAATDAASGDRRAFTEALLTDMLSEMSTNGASPDVIALEPKLKKKANGFSGIVQLQRQVDANYAKVISGVAIYTNPITDKPLAYMATYNGRDREVFILTSTGLDEGVLRPMTEESLAKDADAEKAVILNEWTLIVKNEGYHGVIADLNPAL